MAETSKKSRPLCPRWAAAAFIGCLCFFQAHFSAVGAGPVVGPEYAVKMGFIYNFANFVSWPPAVFDNHPDTLIFCFVADTPSPDIFFKLDGKTVKGRTIKVVAYTDGACLAYSQILFFATQNKTFIQEVLDLAEGRSILTIGEVDGFTRMGGVINFFEEQSRLRFKVNIDAARREGLRMSSQLLGSAQIVREGDR